MHGEPLSRLPSCLACGLSGFSSFPGPVLPRLAQPALFFLSLIPASLALQSLSLNFSPPSWLSLLTLARAGLTSERRGGRALWAAPSRWRFSDCLRNMAGGR